MLNSADVHHKVKNKIAKQSIATCMAKSNFTMNTTARLEKAIIHLTMKIELEYPELSKYIEEMPVRFSVGESKTEIDTTMMDYKNSLIEVMREYSKSHAHRG